jgi:hypothetical protein
VILFEKFNELIDHMEVQAEYGVKLRRGQDPSTARVAFKLFVNELLMGDNTHLIQLGNKNMTAINYGVLNFITTMDESFTTYTKKSLENITQKSTLISEVNEKERLLFFNKLRAKVNNAKQLVVNSP